MQCGARLFCCIFYESSLGLRVTEVDQTRVTGDGRRPRRLPAVCRDFNMDLG